jgi:hypothetical protein
MTYFGAAFILAGVVVSVVVGGPVGAILLGGALASGFTMLFVGIRERRRTKNALVLLRNPERGRRSRA